MGKKAKKMNSEKQRQQQKHKTTRLVAVICNQPTRSLQRNEHRREHKRNRRLVDIVSGDASSLLSSF
jgi:hypothetical protein